MKRFLPLLLCLPLLANDTGINSGAHGPSPQGEFVGEESGIRTVDESIRIRFGKQESEVTMTWKDSVPAVYKRRRGILRSTWTMPEKGGMRLAEVPDARSAGTV
jgi:hypothetical protein